MSNMSERKEKKAINGRNIPEKAKTERG